MLQAANTSAAQECQAVITSFTITSTNNVSYNSEVESVLMDLLPLSNKLSRYFDTYDNSYQSFGEKTVGCGDEDIVAAESPVTKIVRVVGGP